MRGLKEREISRSEVPPHLVWVGQLESAITQPAGHLDGDKFK